MQGALLTGAIFVGIFPSDRASCYLVQHSDVRALSDLPVLCSTMRTRRRLLCKLPRLMLGATSVTSWRMLNPKFKNPIWCPDVTTEHPSLYAGVDPGLPQRSRRSSARLRLSGGKRGAPAVGSKPALDAVYQQASSVQDLLRLVRQNAYAGPSRRRCWAEGPDTETTGAASHLATGTVALSSGASV